MECRYFGECGSCKLFDGGYEGQLATKLDRFKELFGKKPDHIFTSPHSHFRARAEFKIFHGDGVSYAMYKEGGGFVKIDECPIVLRPIYDLMPNLLQTICDLGLQRKLFRIDFLSGLSGEVLTSLVYHRAIDEEWEEGAKRLAGEFCINIIGRSRGKKIVVGKEYIVEKLPIAGREFTYLHYEGSFTQPNPYVNIQMIEWALGKGDGERLVELYCGAGNFTLPFATRYDRIIATEISKTSIKAAKEAAKLNGIDNVHFVRMSSEEFARALEGESFRRLEGIDLDLFKDATLFVDPPRCGLDEGTLEVAKRFKEMIYISCNPETLKRDLKSLQEVYEVEELVLFDQFPYTPHMECGVYLRR